jgi:hypothetical protein
MNKRAKKRIREAVEKKNLERESVRKEQTQASKRIPVQRGFLARPDKKRG